MTICIPPNTLSIDFCFFDQNIYDVKINNKPIEIVKYKLNFEEISKKIINSRSSTKFILKSPTISDDFRTYIKRLNFFKSLKEKEEYFFLLGNSEIHFNLSIYSSFFNINSIGILKILSIEGSELQLKKKTDLAIILQHGQQIQKFEEKMMNNKFICDQPLYFSSYNFSEKLIFQIVSYENEFKHSFLQENIDLYKLEWRENKNANYQFAISNSNKWITGNFCLYFEFIPIEDFFLKNLKQHNFSINNNQIKGNESWHDDRNSFVDCKIWINIKYVKFLEEVKPDVISIEISSGEERGLSPFYQSFYDLNEEYEFFNCFKNETILFKVDFCLFYDIYFFLNYRLQLMK